MTVRHDATLPQAPRMLVVDDDRRRASSLAQWLCSQGGHAIAAGSAAAAMRVIGRGGIELCIVDAGLPDDGAAAVAAAIRGAVPTGGIVAILPGELRGATSSPIWADATVAEQPHDADLLAAIAAARCAGRSRLTTPAAVASSVLGSHPSIAGILDVVDRVAATPATVLVTGESGTGKSLLARELHRRSGRQSLLTNVFRGGCRRLHRRHRRPRRQVPAGRRRHDLPRRDRHSVARHAGEAPPRAARHAV